MTTIASQITSLTSVYSTVSSDADQRKHQSSASPAFVWGIHRDRWIPRTMGQLRGKCFHLMTSSWSRIRHVAWRAWLNWTLSYHASGSHQDEEWVPQMKFQIYSGFLHWSKENQTESGQVCISSIPRNFLTHWGRVTHLYASVNKQLLVQIMARRLVRAKPLSEPVLEYC